MVANWIYLLVVKTDGSSKITFPVSGEADQLGHYIQWTHGTRTEARDPGT